MRKLFITILTTLVMLVQACSSSQSPVSSDATAYVKACTVKDCERVNWSVADGNGLTSGLTGYTKNDNQWYITAQPDESITQREFVIRVEADGFEKSMQQSNKVARLEYRSESETEEDITVEIRDVSRCRHLHPNRTTCASMSTSFEEDMTRNISVNIVENTSITTDDTTENKNCGIIDMMLPALPGLLSGNVGGAVVGGGAAGLACMLK